MEVYTEPKRFEHARGACLGGVRRNRTVWGTATIHNVSWGGAPARSHTHEAGPFLCTLNLRLRYSGGIREVLARYSLEVHPRPWRHSAGTLPVLWRCSSSNVFRTYLKRTSNVPKRTSNVLQTYFKRTSNVPQTYLKRTSNAPAT